MVPPTFVAVLARVKHRLRHAHPRGQMADHVHALQHRPHPGDVGHIAALKMNRRVQALGVSAAQVIDGAHRVAAGNQGVGERRTQEAGAASDEDFHPIPGPGQRAPAQQVKMQVPNALAAITVAVHHQPIA